MDLASVPNTLSANNTARAVLGNPELAGKALAVSHSASAKGAGEVSSASYEARAHGVRAGMFMESAKALCPGLVVMPYEFEKYEAISEQARPARKRAWLCQRSQYWAVAPPRH